MNTRRLATLLFALGVLVILGAIYWSLQSYGSVGQTVASKGIRPTNAIACIYYSGGGCAAIGEAAAAKGISVYTPWIFWLGIALLAASVLTNVMRRAGEGEDSDDRLQRLLIPVDRVSTLIGHAFAWCIVILTFSTSYEVFSRYVLGRPTTWAYDASYILYGALFIMAGAYALCRNGHVRGDFLYRSWRPRVQAGMDLALFFLFFFPGILAFIYAGYGFAAQSWSSHEHSPYSPAGPPIYPFKTLIPMTGVLLLLQGIVEVVRCLDCLKTGAWPRRLHDVEELEKIIQEQHGQEEKRA